MGTRETAETGISAYTGYMLVFIIGIFTVFVYLLNVDEEKLLNLDEEKLLNQGLNVNPEYTAATASGKKPRAAERIRLYAAFLTGRMSRQRYLFTVLTVLTFHALADALIRRRINLLRGVTVTPLKNGVWKRLPAVTAILGIMSFLYVCPDSAAYDAWLGFVTLLWWKALRECVINLPQVTGKMDCL